MCENTNDNLNSFENVKGRMIQYAWDLGCNIALVNALRYSRDVEDLKACVKQACGVGSERFQKTYEGMEWEKIDNVWIWA